ncbi:MAG: molybdopterin-binding protein [Betaproteobacteria bacterium]|nr:molybdopterin-binding protein [Betaproteobacteria bacterium]
MMRDPVNAPAMVGAVICEHAAACGPPRLRSPLLRALHLRSLRSLRSLLLRAARWHSMMVRCLLLLALAFSTQAQAQAQGAGGVAVSGDGIAARSFSTAELAALPRVSAPEKKRDGASFTYEGVTLFELLKAAKAPIEKEVHGEQLTWVVLVQAADGYRVVFTLAELDPTVNDRLVLLADRRDGAALPAAEGPLRVLAAGDKRPTRSARQVVSVTLKKVQ